PNHTQRLDFSLPAGRLDATPRPLSVRVDPGEIVQQTLTMSNNGTGDAAFSIQELNVPPIAVPVTPGPFVDGDTRSRLLARIPTPALRNAPTAKGVPALPGGARSAPTLGGGNVINVYATNLS